MEFWAQMLDDVPFSESNDSYRGSSLDFFMIAGCPTCCYSEEWSRCAVSSPAPY